MKRIVIAGLCLACAAPLCAEEYGFYMGNTIGYASLDQGTPLFATPPVSLPADTPLEILGVAAILDAASPFLSAIAATAPAFLPGNVESTTTVDDAAFSWKAFAGYRFNDYMAMEFGYVDLGTAENAMHAISTIDIDGNLLMGDRTVTIEADSFASIETRGLLLTLNGSYPVYDKVRVFGKVGGFLWKSDITSTTTTQMTTVFTSPPALTIPVPPQQSATFTNEKDSISLIYGAGAEYNFYDNFTLRAEWERYTDIGNGIRDVDVFNIGIDYNFNMF